MSEENENEKSPSRKEFLSKGLEAGLLLAAGAGVLSSVGCSSIRNDQWAMVIDVRRCKGCKACMVACKAENDVRLGVFRCDVKEHETFKDNKPKLNFIPTQCNHCDNPVCIPVCPVSEDKNNHKATYKREDGIVVVDQKRCIECGKCVKACTYDARFMDPITMKASKCDFCVHRLEKGLVPACVNTCSGTVRRMISTKDPEFKKITKNAKVIKPKEGTIPSIYYIGYEEGMFEKGVGTKENRLKEL